ncbi:MAG TPA: hypothetical protein VII12_18960 [Thermoanaerobaculia bacterium]
MKTIWIIDPEQWPRAFLRAEMIERGHDAVGYLSVEDALRNIRSRFPDVVVVELRDVSREDIARLFQIGVPVIGIASLPEPEWLLDFKWGALLRRPISVGEIADAVASSR